jgi:hypothetical protein
MNRPTVPDAAGLDGDLPPLGAATETLRLVADGIDATAELDQLGDAQATEHALEPLAHELGVSLTIQHAPGGELHLLAQRADSVAISPV